MSQIETIYQNGVFKPQGNVGLPENQRVRLNVELLDTSDAQTWLAGVQQRQGRIVTQRGYFPDSTPDIAEDRHEVA